MNNGGWLTCEKSFAATMLYTTKRLPGFAGTGSHLWTRDRDGFEIKEIHRSYPHEAGRFFLANILYGRKIGKNIVFTNGAF
jgi:hypothetical protein